MNRRSFIKHAHMGIIGIGATAPHVLEAKIAHISHIEHEVGLETIHEQLARLIEEEKVIIVTSNNLELLNSIDQMLGASPHRSLFEELFIITEYQLKDEAQRIFKKAEFLKATVLLSQPENELPWIRKHIFTKQLMGYVKHPILPHLRARSRC